jgi:type IV secretory pathway TraG/TraD family ATPase VirD4
MIVKCRDLMSNVLALACRFTLILSMLSVALALALIARKLLFVTCVVLGLIAWRRHRQWRISDAYGSAAICSNREMEKGGLLSEEGIILARVLPERPSLRESIGGLVDPAIPSPAALRRFASGLYGLDWNSDRFIRVRNHIHLLTCSPAGGGKGTAAVIPNGLSYPGNCVFLDVKPELFAALAEHREKRFGKRVIRLDPFHLYGPGDTLNPLDFIDTTRPDLLNQVEAFAKPLIIRGDNELSRIWPSGFWSP